MLLSIVVPVLNEEANVGPLHERVRAVASGLEAELELIFVDDGSRDRTAAVVRQLHASDPRVKLISFSRNFGHQIAITAGMDYARGNVVVVMDADFQHPPELIPTLVERWREGYDVVYSVREDNETAGVFKRWSGSVFYRIFRYLSGVDLPANAADFRLLDRKVVDAFSEIRERTRFLRGLTAWVGYRSIAVPYRAAPRRAGETKYSTRRMLQLAVRGILSFSTVPLRLATYAGALLALVGFVYGAFGVRAWMLGNAVPGWTSTFVLLALVGGLQLIVSGVLGIYLGKIYEELKKRPLYLVSDSVGLDAPRNEDGRRA